MTRDELLELIAAAEKATKGPWSAHDGRPLDQPIADKLDMGPMTGKQGCACGMVWSVPADTCIAAAIGAKDESYTLGEGVSDKQVALNSTHIANCSPERIIELARLALAAMELREGVCHAITVCGEAADELDYDQHPANKPWEYKKFREISGHLQGTLIAADELAAVIGATSEPPAR